MKIQTFICDLCGKKITNYNSSRSKRYIDVAYDFSLEDGCPCKRYVEREDVDMCDECYKKFLESYPIVAKDFNSYSWWKEE